MADPPRDPTESERGDYPGAPRWVKVVGIVVAIPVLLFVIVLIMRLTGVSVGGHGPGRHLRFGGTQAQISSSVSVDHQRFVASRDNPPTIVALFFDAGRHLGNEGVHG